MDCIIDIQSPETLIHFYPFEILQRSLNIHSILTVIK